MSSVVSRAAGVCGSLAILCWLFAALAHAQTSPAAAPSPAPPQGSPQPRPVTGFVSSYEIMRTARAAGFEPLAPPLREGTTYILRATDFRGILMRVVLDARTGVIRDVTRIVPATSGPYGMMPPPYTPPPYAPPPYGPPPYRAPAEYDAPVPEPAAGDEGAPAPLTRPAAPAVPAAPVTAHPALSVPPASPPLPRPRPAALASQKAEKGDKPAGGANPENTTRSGANANTIGVNAGAAPAPSAAPGKTPPVAPLND